MIHSVIYQVFTDVFMHNETLTEDAGDTDSIASTDNCQEKIH